VYSVERQPPLLNYLLDSRAEALAYKAVDLNFMACESCGFVWNATFDPAVMTYDCRYVNDQSRSRAFGQHLRCVAELLQRCVASADGVVVEIACGQGTFLRSLCEGLGRRGIGFDPAYAGPAAMYKNVLCYPQYFTNAHADLLRHSDIPVALIVCRHVLTSLADPAAMIAQCAHVMQRFPQAILYVEVPDLRWIAHHGCFFDLHHESCSLFTPRTIKHLLNAAGPDHVHVQSVFHGQYCGALASYVPFQGLTDNGAASSSRLDPRTLRNLLNDHRMLWKDRMEDILDDGPALVWGAGGKGISFANHLNLGHERLPFMVDIHPDKWNRYVPLTGQEVISPEALANEIRIGIDSPTVLVMNSCYADEIRSSIAELGVCAELKVIDQDLQREVYR
jgi:hypothetical protein